MLLLLAAAQETQLVATLLPAMAGPPDAPGPPINPLLRQQQLLTLLFLNAVGLQRTWDLRSYTGAALALATGRARAYGYRHTERVLSRLAATDGDGRLTDAVARWTSALWQIPATAATEPFYLDGHKKPVYSDRYLPQGLVGRRGAIFGCRHLTVLHDQAGHPLVALTARGDTHLTRSVPPILARFEAQAGVQLRHLVIDREGMAAEFLHTLTAEGRAVTTILRTNQYRDLDSFQLLGDWTPIRTDSQGSVVREVALAQFDLLVPTTPATTLPLRVALIRDHRAQIPSHDPHAASARWDSAQGFDAQPWEHPAWQPSAAPAAPTTARLIPIVSTGAVLDAPALVARYRQRWPAQENSFKDYLIPLGLDVNHGYQKDAIENAVVAKRRSTLETRLATLERWAIAAGRRQQHASVRYDRRLAAHRTATTHRYRELHRVLDALAANGVRDAEYRAIQDALSDVANMETVSEKAAVERAYADTTAEYRKQRRYRQQQCEILRTLADLQATERQLYALDDRKDQVMTACK